MRRNRKVRRMNLNSVVEKIAILYLGNWLFGLHISWIPLLFKATFVFLVFVWIFDIRFRLPNKDEDEED